MRTGQVDKTKTDDLMVQLITEDFQPSTAFQVSERGLGFLEVIPDEMRADVDTIIYGPPETPREQQKLMQVRYADGNFELFADEWSKTSDITESEDVSYVSSPFLPECLRSRSLMRKPLSSNKHRSHECASGESGIADALSEAIVLREVKAMVRNHTDFHSVSRTLLSNVTFYFVLASRWGSGFLSARTRLSPSTSAWERWIGARYAESRRSLRGPPVRTALLVLLPGWSFHGDRGQEAHGYPVPCASGADPGNVVGLITSCRVKSVDSPHSATTGDHPGLRLREVHQLRGRDPLPGGGWCHPGRSAVPSGVRAVMVVVTGALVCLRAGRLRTLGCT
jgi:hypothetical protein